ncbi:hypothetical protein [Meiothermus taiwanensis]|jgi:hypothetical protein|uniref:Uncharacterized protein n=2 Tax=Meiothermus taiwanensis TaxID=172827 RepID=A0A399DZJ6_9DEIN|nr:hypothetical protein [Meiothermus taiwanensis]AWR87357.1 hypothetical protein Mtai_v1c21250 [Meiothermus taiwanensis WR-220]KIQ53744.1 hypothetical protein SY28_12305 [Meiothermus taiwanensis]KZK15706.1 hypothetical protein A3962_01320 [Meiothermus taiwanensis]RIH75540.1 hypothetical protein Mcate_02184 [Meiothermus taiwanensis]
MSLEWALGVLVLLALVALTSFQLGRLSQRSGAPQQPRKRPSHPSVFVDMDDRPPMEIDFEAGIRANQSSKRKHPSRDEASN